MVCRTPCSPMQPVWAGLLLLFCFSFIFLSLKDGKVAHLAPQGKKYASGWPPVTRSPTRQCPNFIPSSGGLRHEGIMWRSSLAKLHLPQTRGSPPPSQGSTDESHFLLHPQLKVAGEQLRVNAAMWDLQLLAVQHASEQPFRSKIQPIKKVNTSFAGTPPGYHQPLLHKWLWELFQQHIFASGM